MSQDNDKDQPETLAPPTDPEAKADPEVKTNPENAVALRPQPLPDDLSSSALLSAKPPPGWEDSFIGRVARDMAADARAIREGKDRNHSEQMVALGDIGQRQEAARKEMRSSLARFGQRLNDVETMQRRLVGDVERIDKRDTLHLSELREIKSIQTALFLKVEMVENGTGDERPLEGKKILIVEDELLLLKVLSKMLTHEGANVLTASSYAEVVAVIENATIDFAIVDIRLEVEDGLQIADWLTGKADINASQILIMTAHLDNAHDELASKLGFRVLEKPFDRPRLVSMIQEALDAAPAPETTTGQ